MIPPSKRWWWESAQTVRRTLERSEYVLHDSARAARNPECTPRVRLQGPVDAAPPGASLLPGTLTLYAFPGCAYPLLRIFDRDLLSLRGLHGRVPLHRLDVLTETGNGVEPVRATLVPAWWACVWPLWCTWDCDPTTSTSVLTRMTQHTERALPLAVTGWGNTDPQTRKRVCALERLLELSENKAHDLAACASIGGVNCACAVLGWEMPL